MGEQFWGFMLWIWILLAPTAGVLLDFIRERSGRRTTMMSDRERSGMVG